MKNEKLKIIDIASVWPDPFVLDSHALLNAIDDHPFGHASFEMMKEIGIVALLIADINQNKPLTRNRAILCALVMKSAKLVRVILAMTQEFGEDRQLALFRELLEALAILNYLLEDNSEGDRLDAYIIYSLTSERAFLETLKKNSKNRGYAQNIELDMEKSIRKTASFGGIGEVELVPGKKRIPWPSTEEMIFMISENAYPVYRAGSGIIHTNWSDLLRNHLEPDNEGTFKIMIEQRGPAPEPLYSGGLMLSIILNKYLKNTNPDAYKLLASKLDDISKRIQLIGVLHSKFRNKQRGHAAN